LLGRFGGPDPAAGYRAFALEQPNLYRLLVEHPLDDLGVPAGRRRRLLEDVLAALSPAGIADDAARDVRIQLHGSVAGSGSINPSPIIRRISWSLWTTRSADRRSAHDRLSTGTTRCDE